MEEASNPGPTVRNREQTNLMDSLEFDLTRLDSSDDEPLIRSKAGRNVMPRLADRD